MTRLIQLICSDPEVRAAVLPWLAEGRLEPRSRVTLEIRVGAPQEMERDGRLTFRQPEVLIRTGPPQGGVQVSWTRAPAVAQLPPGSRTAQVVLSPAAIERMAECLHTFLLTVIMHLLRRAGWHHIHAATAVDPSDRGWLIAGSRAAGKSTTAALLASSGWGVGTDDAAFLAEDGSDVAVFGRHSPIALPPGPHALPDCRDGVLLPEQRKVGYWPEDLGGRWIARVRPEVILFTSLADHGAATQAHLLGRREALTELIRWSAWVALEPDLAHEHLGLLTALARQARGYRVTLGRDLFARPGRLAELVA